MQVGEFSKPFSFTDPRGETFFRLVNLQSRSQPHVASLEKDYAKIQTAATEQKKSSQTAKWVAEKVGSTFIRIDQNLQTCPNNSKWLESGP
jgi:peptidyl-prolyl cis-trans isomerase SurA